ncbi:MAG TPA: TonB family protein [Bryobacteraceae bacterium]|nr:TonB family protein [Bryobacteraceae bacterium]
MTLLVRSEARHRNRSLLVSLGLHGAAFWGLMEAPSLEIPKRAPTEYRQAIAGKEEKLVWYKFRKELPAVTPPKTAGKRPLLAEVKSSQSIVSSADAPKRSQMVWTPAPEIAAAAPLESPNLIAVRLPEPSPKPFTAPPDVVHSSAPPVELPTPPEIEASKGLRKPFLQPIERPQAIAREAKLAADAPEVSASPVQTAELPKRRLPGKVFVRLDRLPAKLASPVRPLEEAPEMAAAGSQQVAALPGAKLPPRQFSAATRIEQKIARQVARLDDAPSLTPAGAGLPANAINAPKLPPKPFAGVAPARAGSGRVASPSPLVEAPPDAEALNVAIVGIRPVETAVALPSTSSPASFASGPKLRPNGADAEAGASGIVVPGLFVKGPVSTGLDLAAQAHAAPTAHETLAAVIRRGEPVAMMRAPVPESPALNGATRVSNAPDPRMKGRDVYMMAIQMPNLTSFSGSWLMWYAARTASEAAAAPLSPPIAHRKVDPKYIAEVAEQRIEGNVQLGCEVDVEGHVSQMQLIRGIDARLNQSAMEALAKWEFYPATRNGTPVAVDVVVEIPFRVAPRSVKKN